MEYQPRKPADFWRYRDSSRSTANTSTRRAFAFIWKLHPNQRSDQVKNFQKSTVVRGIINLIFAIAGVVNVLCGFLNMSQCRRQFFGDM
jgi:hypothetical protein